MSLDPDFEQLVTRYRRPLTAAAYHLCGDPDSAQDIVQETLLDAYRGFASLHDPARTGAWLYTILRRKAYAHRRTRQNEVELPPELPSEQPDLLEDLTRGIVIEQIERLSRDDREILAGKYLLGLSYQELSESLDANEGAIRVRCLRAKERLRKALRGTAVEER